MGGRGPVWLAGIGDGTGPGGLGRRAWPDGPGAGGAPGVDSNGTIAFTSGPANSPSQLLYLVDTKAQAFAVYRVDPTGPRGSGSVKLEAARQYRWDLKLSEFNNQPPEVSAIESMVKSMAK